MCHALDNVSGQWHSNALCRVHVLHCSGHHVQCSHLAVYSFCAFLGILRIVSALCHIESGEVQVICSRYKYSVCKKSTGCSLDVFM